MLFPALLAAVAAIPAVAAQQSSSTPAASYSPYPIIIFEGTIRPVVTGSPSESPANFSATATQVEFSSSEGPRNATNITATAIAGLSGAPPLNATNVTMHYTTGSIVTSTALGGSGYLPVSRVQNVTSTSTSASTTMSCATSMGFERRSSVPTSYGFVTKTTTISIISTTCATVTVTPTASTFTGEVTTTTTITTTSVSTEAPMNVPTPPGFLPLFAFAPAAPTANSRIKRFELEARDAMGALSLLERRSADNYTNGFRAYRNGTTSNIFRRYPQEFDCTVEITIFKTEFVVEQGPPETVIAHVDAATSIRTSTVSSTTTVTSVMPGETIYAACQGNNVGMYK